MYNPSQNISKQTNFCSCIKPSSHETLRWNQQKQLQPLPWVAEKKNPSPLRIFVHLDDQLLAKFALHEALVQLMRLGNSRARWGESWHGNRRGEKHPPEIAVHPMEQWTVYPKSCYRLSNLPSKWCVRWLHKYGPTISYGVFLIWKYRIWSTQ